MSNEISNIDNLYSIEFQNDVLKGIFIAENLEKKDVVKIIAERRKVTDKYGKKPLLIDITKVKKISREARLYLSSAESNEGLTAAAIIAPNGFAKALANFFIRVNLINPMIPTKMFTSEKEALKWLEQYKQVQND